MSKQRTLRITGRGCARIRPDLTRITMSLEGIYQSYDETIRHSSEDVERLKDILTKVGFERSDVKTLHFCVDTEYAGRTENGVFQRRFVGYKYDHILKLEFDPDNERLGRILYALANCPAEPEFRISYTVKDPEKAKEKILVAAVQDARTKAMLLSQSAGVSLGEIKSIDYSWGEISLEVRPVNRMFTVVEAAPSYGEGSYPVDIEPEEIEAADTVTVVWKIS